MARNGSGVFSKPVGTTAVSGTTIDSVAFNTLADDIAADLNLPRPVVAGGTGGATAVAARASLGVAIGTDVQGFDAGLASIAGLTTAADKGVYTTGADTYATFALGALSRTFLANTTTAGFRSTLGLGTAAVENVIDEDSFATNSATRPPSQQSTKAYIASYAQPAYDGTGAFPADGAATSVAHGLGVKPARVQVTAQCTVANNGYSVGDEVLLGVDDSTGRGKAVFFSTTQVGFARIGLAYFISKTGATQPALTSAEWQLRFRAWV